MSMRRGGAGGAGPRGEDGMATPGNMAAAPTPGASGSGTNSSTDSSMIQFKIDADKLPKAEDLKNYLFASTVSITVSDQDIRLISREAFPNLASNLNSVSMAMIMPSLKSFVESQQQAAQAAAAATTPPAATQPAAGPGGGRPGGPGGPGGRPGGRRRGDE